jgi:carboxyl-terminal processing protease
MPRRNLVWIVGFLLLSLFSYLLAGLSIAPPHGPLQFIKGFPNQNKDYGNLALFNDVMQHIDMHYVRSLAPDERRKFIETAINAGLETLDKNSGFANPKEAQALRKQIEGKYGGIGVQVLANRETGRVQVVTTFPNSPAFRAGIRPGDEIERVNGQTLRVLTTEDVVEQVSGPAGTSVNLTIRRRASGSLIDLTLVREEIHLESLLGDQRLPDQQWDFMIDKENRVGYVRLASYNSDAVEQLRAVLDDLQKHEARGFILDLRNNPGGALDGAVNVCDLFLQDGEIVRIEGRSNEARIYRAHAEGTRLLPEASHPIVVLINRNSASASEIVAGALQDHHRATIIGERSYGKGSVQRVYPMEGGSSNLRLTTARYLRPSGRNIHKFTGAKEADEWGVRPDIEVKLAPAEEEDWLRGRFTRDLIHDADNDRLDQAEKAAAVAGPIGLLPRTATPLGFLPGVFESSSALLALPRPQRPYADRVLDRALEYLRTKAKPQKSS